MDYTQQHIHYGTVVSNYVQGLGLGSWLGLGLG